MVHGYQLTKTCTLLSENIRQGVLLHHERNDGSGYPFGQKKDKIPFMARVLAIVDTHDVMALLTGFTGISVHRLDFCPF